MLVGAGGHFCPVARMLNGSPDRAALVVGAGGGVRDRSTRGRFRSTIAPEHPELYFCRDLKGYGWCFRKQDYLNIGFGRLDSRALPKASAEFVDFLKARHTIPRHCLVALARTCVPRRRAGLVGTRSATA